MTNQTLMTLSTISSEANKYTIWRCYKRPTLQKTHSTKDQRLPSRSRSAPLPIT